MCTVAKAEKCVTKWSQSIFDVASKFKYRTFPKKYLFLEVEESRKD